MKNKIIIAILNLQLFLHEHFGDIISQSMYIAMLFI